MARLNKLGDSLDDSFPLHESAYFSDFAFGQLDSVQVRGTEFHLITGIHDKNEGVIYITDKKYWEILTSRMSFIFRHGFLLHFHEYGLNRHNFDAGRAILGLPSFQKDLYKLIVDKSFNVIEEGGNKYPAVLKGHFMDEFLTDFVSEYRKRYGNSEQIESEIKDICFDLVFLYTAGYLLREHFYMMTETKGNC